MKLNEKPFNEPQMMNVLLQMHMQSLLIYKDIHQSEKAIKGLKTISANIQTQIEERQKQLEDLDGKMRSGKIHL